MSNEPAYVTIDKLALHFGLAVTTLQKWVKTGIIPRDTYVKAGQTYRFNVGAVERVLTGAANTYPSETEHVPETNPDEDM